MGGRPDGGRGYAFAGGGSPEGRPLGGLAGLPLRRLRFRRPLLASGLGVCRRSGFAGFGGPASAAPDSASASAPVPAAVAGLAPAIPSVLHGRRPATRPSHFDDAGLAILRTPASDGPEIWCRCDGGPHGFLSIAAHAHADALVGGAPPRGRGHPGRPRDVLLSRRASLALVLPIDHRTQHARAGRPRSVDLRRPFLWTRRATTRVLQSVTDYPDSRVAGGWRNGSDAEVLTWSAEHDGYAVLESPASHRRTVRLRRWKRSVEIVDRVESSAQHPFRLAFHLGAEVTVDLDGHTAGLAWSNGSRSGSTAVLELPSAATWKIYSGSDEPVLGWYSRHFGEKEPSSTLVGSGVTSAGRFELVTTVQFDS